MKTTIAIVGAGWYGVHSALELSEEENYDVTLIDQNGDLANSISGKFGVRLHSGPHYPRSEQTRVGCQRGFQEFHEKYPELVVDLEYALYGFGDKDADGYLSKVSVDTFQKVCRENQFVEDTHNPSEWGYSKNMLYAAKLNEPGMAVGDRLRSALKSRLQNSSVRVKYNFEIVKTEAVPDNKVRLIGKNKGQVEEDRESLTFDYVVNATSYQSAALRPDACESLPLDVVYQTCLAFGYKDKSPKDKHFSFIVMDGFFPCMMPYADNNEDHNYIVTHGKWTILGSFDTPQEGYKLLEGLKNNHKKLEFFKVRCEAAMKQFWPAFTADRFEYTGWKGGVLAKLRTDTEFRGAVTFADKRNVIHIIPGKVTNIFDVSREVGLLIKGNRADIVRNDTHGYAYVRDGVLDAGMKEISAKPSDASRNTGFLQTHKIYKEPSLVRQELAGSLSPPRIGSTFFRVNTESRALQGEGFQAPNEARKVICT